MRENLVLSLMFWPIMKCHDLYDKRSGTLIWYSGDECRLPIKINAKILIGSLTARQIVYES
ncbi:MAG: DUF3108 domain-containing protein [Desulfobulbaceae bacterium]|jgi:hypothetical protein|nr:DUF3108 domain-containing protein [Desulfobulbaceae bacterium]